MKKNSGFHEELQEKHKLYPVEEHRFQPVLLKGRFLILEE